MSATATVEVEPQAAEMAELTDDTREELVALREGGMTLAELKARFPQLTGEQIREVLPPANARERKQREVKAKTTETTQGTGGRFGKKQSEPKPKAKQESKPEPKSRYIEDNDLAVSLSERTLAARQVMGRSALAEALDTTGSAVWRFENGRIHPGEVKTLQDGLKQVEDRIAKGEFVKPEKQPAAKQASKADLIHRVEVVNELLRSARSDKSITKASLIDSALAVLAPTDAPKA